VRSQSRPEEIQEGGVSQNEEKKLAEENGEEIENEEKLASIDPVVDFSNTRP